MAFVVAVAVVAESVQAEEVAVLVRRRGLQRGRVFRIWEVAGPVNQLPGRISVHQVLTAPR